VVAQGSRLYCWVIFALQEATRRLQRLRTLLCGTGVPAVQRRASTAASPLRTPVGTGAGAGAWRSREAEASGVEDTACAAEPGASSVKATSTPTGGQRLGPGRLGAEASEGAERVECRHADVAVGQRCPVWGQGRLDA